MTDSTYNAADVTPKNWVVRDSDNLGKITAAQAVISALLGVLVVVSIAGLVLGIIGYLKVSDRLDNIEHWTHETAEYTAPTPAP